MQRNQFLRLFLCEREIIVNALFLLKCLENGQNQIQVQRYKYYLKIDNILWKRTKKKQTFTNKEVLYSKFCNKFNNKIQNNSLIFNFLCIFSAIIAFISTIFRNFAKIKTSKDASGKLGQVSNFKKRKGWKSIHSL